ncbi:MAG TPA: hypothetical protein VMS60_10560 [Solirubrobacterales bacterium]|nr:hypothetical protein [Solirubrobacterales bacterium]
MNGRKAIVGLCVLCALLVNAVAAQSASAITGTTVFTCKEGAGDVGGRTFSGDHCRPGDSEGKYGHYKVAENTTTELTGNSNGESMKLKTTVGGVAGTLTATGLQGSGSMENAVDPSGEHYVQASLTGVFKEVTINVPKCFVYTHDGTATPATQGVIDTQQLKTTSTGQGDAVKFEPNEGQVFARLWLADKNKVVGGGSECICSGTYTITGSVKGEPNGATFVFTHAGTTTQNTLKMGTGESGVKAGLEGTIAFEGKDPAIEKDTYKPLSVTTVTTE